jgi:uroporphyrinogen-III synthase
MDDAEVRGLIESGDLSALLFTSPSTVDHLLAALTDEGLEAARRCTIAAIGRTTARRLDEVGLSATVIAERPDVPSLVEALVEASGA